MSTNHFSPQQGKPSSKKPHSTKRAVKATTPPRVRWPDTLPDSEFAAMCASLNMAALVDDLRRLLAKGATR